MPSISHFSPSTGPRAATYAGRGATGARATAGGELRILLIEDSRLLRDRMIGMLTVPGVMQVTGTAETEREAIELIDSNEYDALVVDVELKQANGRMSFEEVPDTTRELPCELALLAMGFVHPERGVLDQFGVRVTERGNVWRDGNWMTSVEGVFTAGDMQRGQSLIVWAIAEGRSAAAGIDRFLMGGTELPAPLP